MSIRHLRLFDELVRTLRDLGHVRAIAAYGSSATKSWADGSDIDLLVVTAQQTPVESLHFFRDGIPIDLGMRNRTEWEEGRTHWLPPDGMIPVWDPEDLVRNAVSRPAASGAARNDRYSHRHLLLKLKRWQDQDSEVADVLAAGAPHWIIVSYFHARGMRFPGIDQAVPYLRSHDPEILECLLSSIREQNHRVDQLGGRQSSACADRRVVAR